RSPQEEEDNLLINPPPLPNGIGDTFWVSTSAAAVADFQRHIVVNGFPTDVPQRAIVLKFDKDNWDQNQTVYVYAVDDPRAEGDRVVVSQHSVISNVPAYDGVAVRNVEVTVRDNDTPGVYVTEVEPGGSTEHGRTGVGEGTNATQREDEILVELARAPEVGDPTVLKLDMDIDGARAVTLSSADGRFSATPDGLGGTVYRVSFTSANWDS